MNGISLAELAAAKRLPEQELSSYGLRDGEWREKIDERWLAVPAVVIPYRDVDGHHLRDRYRTALVKGATDDERFRWGRGSGLALYGLWRLHGCSADEGVLLVEGESDCWTAWHCGLACLGVPGKAAWSERYGPAWAELLAGREILVWQEPEAEDFVARVAVDLPNVRIIAAPPGIKDLSEAHLQGHNAASLLAELRAAAVPASEMARPQPRSCLVSPPGRDGGTSALEHVEAIVDRPDGADLDRGVRRFADAALALDETARAAARSTALRLLAERHVPSPAALLHSALRQAEQGRQDAERKAAAIPARLPATVQPPQLAQEPDIPARAAEALNECGLVGEDRLVQLLYLAITSRLLARPVNVVVKGPSAAGKSFAVERVCELFPAEAYLFLTGMSEHALAYGSESLTHRTIVVCEAAALASDTASYFLRSLLSEGRIRYETVDRTDAGLQSRIIERQGPAGVIITTTAVALHPENETRMLSITATDSPLQTRAILLATARATSRTPADVEQWRCLQAWLADGEHEVAIPFAEELAQKVPPVAVRLRRDFPTLLTLIATRALLHRATRARDDCGRIVAALDDYAAVRELVVDLIGDQVQATVSTTLRETVEAVDGLTERLGHAPTYAQIGEHLGLDRSSAQRRARAAEHRGYLRNLEEQRGKPARLTLGEPLPGEVSLLPDLGVRDEPPRVSAAPHAPGGCTVAERPQEMAQTGMPSAPEADPQLSDSACEEQLYLRAVACVRDVGAGSPALLRKRLGVDEDTAVALIGRLRSEDVLTADNVVLERL